VAQVRPCVLHGDLWSGNIGSVDGEPSIFDPAVYYGHSEADFGMSWCAGTFGADALKMLFAAPAIKTVFRWDLGWLACADVRECTLLSSADAACCFCRGSSGMWQVCRVQWQLLGVVP